ncbi:MAG: response regulator [Verrucomicrobia bacterium]|nr:response regulator [Verrucomicrobiota bacterium]
MSDSDFSPASDAAGEGAWHAHRVSQARHDLRNPTSEVLGFTEMLLEEAVAANRAEVVAALRAIYEAASQILKQVNQTLDLQKLQAEAYLLDELRVAIRHSTERISATGENLLRTSAPFPTESFAGDLRRILDAAGRLRDVSPGLLAALRAGEAPPRGWRGPELDARTVLAATENHFETGSVLVVDDNESNRELLTRRLLRHGCAVAVAENGRQALEMLRARPFDLVLLDIVMPELDGYQVLSEMKRDEQLRGIPIIVLSALDEMESVVRCIANGAEDYLPKPFDPVLLRARIGACLEKKHLHDREISYLRQIEEQRRRADDLLHVILPEHIAHELKTTNAVKPRRYENVAVLFCDVVDFTAFCDKHEPEEVLEHLQALIRVFEELTALHGLEEIKTIGDAFMATAGLLAPMENSTLASIQCGLEMLSAARRLPAGWQVHVGIHTGPVIAGVVGQKKFLFDVWGDTVNTSARVASLAGPGSVFVSSSAWAQVQDRCLGHSCGLFQVKGKGQLEVFRVEAVLDRATG